MIPLALINEANGTINQELKKKQQLRIHVRWILIQVASQCTKGAPIQTATNTRFPLANSQPVGHMIYQNMKNNSFTECLRNVKDRFTGFLCLYIRVCT